MEKTTLKTRMAAAAREAVKAAKTSAFLGVAGCILAGGIGFAQARYEVAKRQDMVKWANDDGTWVNVDGQTEQTSPTSPGDYRCNGDEGVCTGEFAEGINPNSVGAPPPTNVRNGEYEAL